MFEQIAPSINIGCVQSPWPEGCRQCMSAWHYTEKDSKGWWKVCMWGRRAQCGERGQIFFFFHFHSSGKLLCGTFHIILNWADIYTPVTFLQQYSRQNDFDCLTGSCLLDPFLIKNLIDIKSLLWRTIDYWIQKGYLGPQVQISCWSNLGTFTKEFCLNVNVD